MARNFNASVIIPLMLAFGVGVMVYLYGTARSQYNSAEEELKEIKKDLADARSEKESLRYELDTLTDQLEQISKDKTEALQRAESAEEIAHKANEDVDKLRTTLSSVQEELHKAQENSDELQGNRDKVKGDLTTYISKWKQCEAAKKDIDILMRQKSQESDTTIQGLRGEVDRLTSSKIDAERRLNEVEQSLQVCESQRQSSLQQRQQQSQKQRGPVVDDRSMELLPPVGRAKDSPANSDLGGVAVGEQNRAVRQLSEREKPGGGVAMMDDQEPAQKQSQLNFDPHEEVPDKLKFS